MPAVAYAESAMGSAFSPLGHDGTTVSRASITEVERCKKLSALCAPPSVASSTSSAPLPRNATSRATGSTITLTAARVISAAWIAASSETPSTFLSSLTASVLSSCWASGTRCGATNAAAPHTPTVAVAPSRRRRPMRRVPNARVLIAVAMSPLLVSAPGGLLNGSPPVREWVGDGVHRTAPGKQEVARCGTRCHPETRRGVRAAQHSTDARAGHTENAGTPTHPAQLLYPAVVGRRCLPSRKTRRAIPQATSAYTASATSEDNSRMLVWLTGVEKMPWNGVTRGADTP